jgi:hypothetical protein
VAEEIDFDFFEEPTAVIRAALERRPSSQSLVAQSVTAAIDAFDSDIEALLQRELK